jgi:hypothetical protein
MSDVRSAGFDAGLNADERARLREIADSDSRLKYPTKGLVQDCLRDTLDALEAALAELNRERA